MTGTSVEVDAGRIVLRPSFADMLLCGQIPGGAWDRARRAWSFPATMQVAAAIRAKVRHLNATEQFDVLLAGAEPHVRREPSGTSEFTGSHPVTALAPVNVPELEAAIPEGMRTRPWRHQVAAYTFCLDKFATGVRAILLPGPRDSDRRVLVRRAHERLARRRKEKWKRQRRGFACPRSPRGGGEWLTWTTWSAATPRLPRLKHCSVPATPIFKGCCWRFRIGRMRSG